MKKLCLLLTLWAAPVAAQDVSIPFTKYELSNGLTLIVHEDHSVPMAAVNVWYHVGSGYEEPGRTGFAHLFEHIMFEGSANVPEGDFDNLLEAAGGVNNGSTNSDRTNYYEIIPSNAVKLALWLEADRMGGLLETMTDSKLDLQRAVVKNERRQSYENRPYGIFFASVDSLLYPTGHPYSWSTIGSMDDLSAASREDVSEFFRRYYSPNNAVVAVAGDVDAEEVRATAERFFGWIPSGPVITPPDIPIPPIPETRYVTLEDRVTLPQVNLIWRTTPAFSEDAAALNALAQILASGKNSRLYKRLIYDEQVAQNLYAYNDARLLSGDFYVQVTGRESVDLEILDRAVREEIAKLAAEPPTAEELQRVKSGIQTGLVGSLESVAGKANQLNAYYYYTGDPDFSQEELARYQALTPADIQRAARTYLTNENSVVVSVVPMGQLELATNEEVAR
ncbi:MAG TPA: pitrilysin family protein [Longimicrobiaceae bacterium]|nr:pitrilysin family protein [Longimicrobiaceae bacterium]